MPKKKPSKKINRAQKIAQLKEIEAKGLYQAAAPNRKDYLWRQHMEKDDHGRLSSLVKGIDMEYVTNVPLTDTVAECINPIYFNDPLLIAKKSFDHHPLSPQFDKKNVFGHFAIKTAKQKELENVIKANKRYTFRDHNDDDDRGVYVTPRQDNSFTQSLIHPSNEIFETGFRHKPKGGTGVSIMSGEFNKVNKLAIRTYDQEKVPYAGASIDLSQPEIYRVEVQKGFSRNNPMTQSVKTFNNLGNTEGINPFGHYEVQNQSFNKSKFSTMPKRINSMERILDWKPKGLHKLNMYNSPTNIFMEKSLKNTIPYRQSITGKQNVIINV